MPLSADSISGFFNSATSRCEVFAHVSLATTAAPSVCSLTTATAAPSSNRFYGTPVLETGGTDFSASNGSNCHHNKNSNNSDGSARVVPTGAVVPPSSVLSWTAETKGTLYICALPEMMWNSIAATTTYSAPSQRQPAFSSEAPAFCISHSKSFVQGERDSIQSTPQKALPTRGGEEKVNERAKEDDLDSSRSPNKHIRNVRLAEEELPEMSAFGKADESTDGACTTPQQTQTARRHCDSMVTEDERNRRASLDRLSPYTVVPSSSHECLLVDYGVSNAEEGAEEGIQLPGMTTNRLNEFPSSLIHSDRRPQEQQRNTLEIGRLSAFEAVWPPRSPSTASATLAEAIFNPRTVEGSSRSGPASVAEGTLTAGTVTVLLWVAADASSTAVSEMSNNCTTPSPVQKPPTFPRNDGSHALRLSNSTGGDSSNGGTAVTTATAAPSMPACLCFSVRDIAKAESGDAVATTTRERRVKRFTVVLESGAPIYTAKSTSDIFESAASQSALCLRLLPSGGLSCSFVFYQGGITRCVFSLRKYSPKLTYTCLGLRHNNSTMAAAADGSASPTPLSRASSAQLGLIDLYPGDANGNLSTGPTTGVHSSFNLPWKDSTGSPLEVSGYLKQSPSPENGQPQQTKSAGGGWSSRFLPAGLFRHSKHAVPTSDHQMRKPLHSASPTSSFISSANTVTSTSTPMPAMTGIANGVGVVDKGPLDREESADERKKRGGPHNALPGDGESSSSSFEDLEGEMTAMRLGSCYVPPKPFLPPLEESDASMSCVTVEEWEAVFDATPAAGGITAKKGRVLNANRWRAFRQSLFERGGLADNSVRFEVWCYLLRAYPIDSTQSDQKAILEKEKELYTHLTTQWKAFLPVQEEHFSVYRYAKHSIFKDVERTDRTHPAFHSDDSDMLHLLQEVLLAHVMYNMDLGYSQGMSDLVAIASLVVSAADAAAVFLCFRKMLDEHMADNFVIEERKKDAPYAAVKGLQRKLYQVQVLTRHFHPRLYGHLKMRCMTEDMTFCFRWLLVCFKRDLNSVEDTMRFWDVLFACPYTKSYEVIVTVALLVALAPQLIKHIHAYETLLQFMNSLSSGISVEQILRCAREFYENVCVVETRELYRQHRRAGASLVAINVQKPMSECLSGDRTTLTSRLPPSAAPSAMPDGKYFPTVEEMVLLFLETDGPL